MYKLVNDSYINGVVISKSNVVHRTTDNAFIPFADDNADYQVYLKWLAEGNTPEPADEPLPDAE